MFSRLFFCPRLSVVSVFVSCLFSVLLIFTLASPVRAATCDCTCGWGLTPASRSAAACTGCNAACHDYCFTVEHADTGYAGFPPQTSVGTCRAEAGTPAPTPSTVRPSSGSTSAGTSRRRATDAGTGTSGGSAGTSDGSSGSSGSGSTGSGVTGTCTFNCITPRLTACVTSDDCQALCTTQCPTLVGGGATCATNPAPRCLPAVDGAKHCAFECVVNPPESCQVGDAGNIQCGFRSLAVCVPPAGAGPTAPTIRDSTVVQPRCIAPSRSAGTSGEDSGVSDGQNGGTSGASGGRSGSSGSGTSGSYALSNPIRGANTLPAIIGKAVRAIMGLVGAVALLMFVLGGVRWILAAGDAKEVQAASDLLKNASIGLLIIFLSYTVITVGMGLVNDLAGQGDASGTGQTTNVSSQGTTATNATNRTAPPVAGSVAACNASYPARPFSHPDCAACQAACTNILCRVNAPDASSDTAPPPVDPRNLNASYRFPAGLTAVTTECLTRCRATADCPAS